ncbi:hypothetical protein SBV1_450017 [Verrucomicrobia bacterium]|nr:hypothetical protein SBV1_450017 [Verrucomicrobiota bacterium]
MGPVPFHQPETILSPAGSSAAAGPGGDARRGCGLSLDVQAPNCRAGSHRGCPCRPVLFSKLGPSHTVPHAQCSWPCLVALHRGTVLSHLAARAHFLIAPDRKSQIHAELGVACGMSAPGHAGSPFDDDCGPDCLPYPVRDGHTGRCLIAGLCPGSRFQLGAGHASAPSDGRQQVDGLDRASRPGLPDFLPDRETRFRPVCHPVPYPGLGYGGAHTGSAVRDWHAEQIFSQSWLVYVGKISYGLYLWHYPIFVEVQSHHWAPSKELAIELALSAAATLASYYLLERPVLRLKVRFAGTGVRA